jgi:tetratricopeptide (TPR) repeat protein
VYEQNPSSAYTNVVDIWSLGCVIYQIVAKQVPFQNGRDIGRFCDGRISFPAQPLQGKLTTDGIEFLITILVASPAARPTADVALQHLWLVPDDDYIESFPRLENEAAKEEKLSACQEPSKSIQIRPDYHCEGQESVQPLGDKIQQLSREPGNQIIRAVDVEGGRSPDPARYLIPAIELFLRTLKPERDRSGERERSLERKASLELISNRTIGESIAASTYTAVGLSRPVNVEKEEAIYLNDRGRSAYMAQNFASAIDYHTKALSLFPTDPTILCNRAAAYYRLGDYDNALPDADAAVLSGGPHLALGWYWLGTTLYKRGDRKGSMDAYQMCIKCEGQNELRIWVQEWLTELEAEKDNEDKDYGTRGHDRTITCGSRGATLPVLKRKPEYHDIVPKHNDATGNIIAGIGSNNVPRRGFKGGRRGLLNHEMTKKASNMRSIPSCAACYITQVVVSQSYD